MWQALISLDCRLNVIPAYTVTLSYIYSIHDLVFILAHKRPWYTSFLALLSYPFHIWPFVSLPHNWSSILMFILMAARIIHQSFFIFHITSLPESQRKLSIFLNFCFIAIVDDSLIVYLVLGLIPVVPKNPYWTICEPIPYLLTPSHILLSHTLQSHILLSHTLLLHTLLFITLLSHTSYFIYLCMHPRSYVPYCNCCSRTFATTTNVFCVHHSWQLSSLFSDQYTRAE